MRSNHRRPLRHWRGVPPKWAIRIFLEFVICVLVLAAILVVAEGLGCPRAPGDLR